MKSKQRYFTILLLLLASWSFRVSGQETFTLNGKITDAATGENLIGVTIYVEEAQTGTTTNTYGFYSISLPAGTYRVRYSYIGYLPEEKTIALRQRQTANLELTPHDVEVGEVLISAERRDKNITSPEIGVERLSIKQLGEIPVIFGEKDILKTIQLLPGISMTSEGSTGFNVRGGAMDQNLILLDEAPV
ncbi:MAG TPA: carboxypeptidase-like regulatory domain-containing protein, partial [Prolixibacteraceae bacterium]|nr:carboxypeptidase-like regulatory domain-containing protein [Prolixibacteraceae bacterium]